MAYATFTNGEFQECSGYIVFSPTVYQTAESLTDEQREEFGVFLVIDDKGDLAVGNQWANHWTYSLDTGVILRKWHQEPIPQWAKDKLLAKNVDTLWRAADAYQSAQICGAAIGLLTIAVLQQKPKAIAVQAWITSIWDDYYRRKALLTYDAVPDVDFSMFGTMPHSIPELREELGM